MDAMALLCNLQADGPQTLRRLHRIGCHTLGDLERVPVFELAEALESDAGFAQRFVREARALRQRFGTGELEPETRDEGTTTRAPARPEAAVERENAPPPPARQGLREPVRAGDAPRAPARAGSGLREPVRADGGLPEPARAGGGLREPVRAGGGLREPVRAGGGLREPVRAGSGLREPVRGDAPEAPRPAAPPAANRPFKSLATQPPGTALRAGLVEGLGEGWCRALVGQGVLTLETLIDAPGLALARSLGRSYTELCDLQCLAKRYLAQQGASATLEREGEPPAVLRPAAAATSATRPALERDHTIVPPAPAATRPAPERPARPVAAQPAAPSTTPTTSERRREEQDAGIGGPFA